MRVLGSSLFLDNPELAETFGTIAMTVVTFPVFNPKTLGTGVLAGLAITTLVSTSAHTLLGGYASI
ncbi:MAG: hypothetical protein ABGX04_19470 [Myxococcales bacterium]